MAADERNFRASYYEKVGCRSVEEKKSLEILLKDNKTLDKVKLQQFCLRFTVPGIYRNLVWKVLFDVLPIHVDSHKFVMEQREQEYSDLVHSLHFMRMANDQTPKPHLFLLMWLLETGKLKYSWNTQINNTLYQSLRSISQSLLNVFDNSVDIYWISKGFFQFVDKFYNDVPKLTEYTWNLLEKEDQILFNHLLDIGAWNVIPLQSWLCSCFAGVISESSLGKVWDKLAGGSCKILVFVAVVILRTLRRNLLSCKMSDNVLNCLNNIPEETAEIIVNKAIEMWQQYGSLLTPGAGPDNLKAHLPVSRNKPAQGTA
ncbi:TBC1 domain family member 7 [Cryptotermes secundus]|uniref:TBC1 domain family member 7 n=1 Tax=Cryptotermes secundus TaxID=105785 RepID=A0A2J7PT35_9NEOP|nr:TBC1 domain family member 7 [Cryptotermes secundus]PNF19492.1 TBC1 domain family member 7 [Cryptotermes secundus]